MTAARALCAVLLRGLVPFLILAGAAPLAAQAAPQAGQEYRELDPPHATAAGTRIEVLEFFYYGCPVCYETQPRLTAWRSRAGADVALLRIPAAARGRQERFARVYYALEAMGELERLHDAIYEHHHFDGAQLGDAAGMERWLARNGIDAARFRALVHAPAIDSRIAEARRLATDYGVRGVPTLVVGGRFLTSARLAGGVEALIDVLDVLLERARRER